ncbi:MAG: hypothetical protein KDJ87_15090 [Rhizobiaceae bacterium]|nr:hypothetical protein [Rhizobiaceae bacterium]
MSTFKYAIAICGLSQSEAAEFLQVSIDTIKSWSSSRAHPPFGVWSQLASLWRQIEEACDGAASEIEIGRVDRVYFNNIEADIVGNELPFEGARKVAGAMALLIALEDLAEEDA